MTETVILEVSVYAATLVSNESPRDLKLLVAQGELELEGGDMGSILYYLSHDPDPEVSLTAIRTLQTLSGDLLKMVVESPETHFRVLDILARLNATDRELLKRIACLPSVSDETLQYLADIGIEEAKDALEAESEVAEIDIEHQEEEEPLIKAIEDEAITDDEHHTKYQLVQTMGMGEKVKMAITGDKEWRNILIKDTNKLVSSTVLKNPRITDAEILAVVKSTVQNDDLMRSICTNREWVKNYEIRKALVENNKTPLPFALRFLSSLGDKDIASFAKSKNISSVIATQARRIILNKQKKS